jgi:hypothetical protein
MTFEQWRSTRKKVASIEDALGADDFGPGYVYRGLLLHRDLPTALHRARRLYPYASGEGRGLKS